MAEIIFDSRDTFFKTPQGAVKAGSDLAFRFLAAEELRPTAVRLIVQYDRHDTPAVYEMTGETDTSVSTAGYQAYATSFTIHDTGLYWYNFEVQTEDGLLRIGKGDANCAVIAEHPAAWQQTVYDRAFEAPEWIYGGIYYHVFVDRFHKSGRPRIRMEGKTNRHDWGGMPEWKPKKLKVLNNDFFGGDLEGIRQKLPYLAGLHVTCLYLSPVFEAYSNHKYDTGDYEKIDPMFGTEDDFRALCESAAEYGIRVICDGVFAHTGSDSKYFDKYGHYDGDGAYENPDSPYRSWYYFHEDGTYDCWWNFRTLPKLNKHDPSYIEYITGENGVVRKWLRAGASGWRLDVADELPNDFLDALVRAAKTEKSDSLIVGEVWEDASNKIAYEERKNYFEGNRLDAVMNYPFKNGIVDFVRHGNAEGLAQTVESIVENYPPEVLHSLMNVLGTHDSVRIITALAGVELGADPPRDMQAQIRMNDSEWALGIRRLKTASLIQMTLPGVPCIYYGDEAGTEGYKDPFNRTCYPWGHENRQLLDWYRKVTEIRSSHDVYRCGGYRTLMAGDGFYAFERHSGEDRPDEAMITAANCGEHEHHLPLEGQWTDLLTGLTYDGTITIYPGDALLLERSN